MDYNVKGVRPRSDLCSRGRAKKTRIEIVEKDCQIQHLNKEDENSKWRKLIKDIVQ